jgi:alpha-D-ribose 1-methylphosphonate 5-triphosphate diphosphatase
LVDCDSRPICFDHVHVILPDDEIQNGSVLIEGGVITAICPETTPSRARRLDLEGKILMPGLIDLHSDAIEHEVQPRPGTILPFDLAVRQADRLFATVGISTAFHSLSFWSDSEQMRSNGFNAAFTREIARLNAGAIIDNLVHVRFEVTNREGLSHINELLRDGLVGLASIMDHTPGQGQYADEQKFLSYFKSTGMSEAEADEVLRCKKLASKNAKPTMEAFARLARECGIPLASHDDDRPDNVREMHRLGVSVSEFPMTYEAAEAAIELGYTVLVGAPNIMRGGSTGTGPKAMELIERGLANALCSDYMPATIMPSIFKISEELGWPLWRAVRLATMQPAIGGCLSDRGQIGIGKRADLIVVEFHHDWPIVRHLWSAGRLAYAGVPAQSRPVTVS